MVSGKRTKTGARMPTPGTASDLKPATVSAMRPDAVETMFQRFAASNPSPQGELVAPNPYCLLVAVVLSAQATDVSVNKATAPLFARVQSPEAMLALGEDRLREAIKTIGLFNTKAKNVIALSAALIDRHGGAVPADRDALETLPGVGRKTANVVLQMAFGQEAIAVDTHVFRVANRTGLAAGATPRAVEDALLVRVPGWARLHAHHWLILHGRYVCVARKPRCFACPVADICLFQPKTSPPADSAAVQRGS